MDRHEFKRINETVVAGVGEPAISAEIILGTTRARR
jgi:DNA-directed RNA polymerase subunit beta'